MRAPPLTPRLLGRCALTLAAILLPGAASAQDPAPPPQPPAENRKAIDELVQGAREARDAGRYDEARSSISEALSNAGDPTLASRLRFDLALTYQLEGEARGNDARALEKAVLLYDAVLKERPGSAATLCNQARAYARLGRWELAEERYREAAQVEGPDQPFYLRKYADYLAERGDWTSAEAFYETVALARPQSTEAHEVLLAHYREISVDGTGPLTAYLWKLVAAGEGQRAAEAALDVLERPGAIPGLQASSTLMSIIAAGLSRGLLDPDAFLASSAAKRLAGLEGHPAVGLGARELLGLVRSSDQPGSPEKLAARLSWWRSVPPWAEGDPLHGVWAHDAMRAVLLSLGGWYERQADADHAGPHYRISSFRARKTESDDAAVAEAFYRAALILVPGDPDPGALRHLLDFFIARNDLARVETALGEYEVPLLEAKDQAYRRSDLAKIYDFHTTLGSLYGYLASKGQRDWGSSGDVRSAIFQLERAVEVGKALDERPSASLGRKSLHLEPSTVEYLARAYEATGQMERSARLCFDAAIRFGAAGDLRAARFVLAPERLKHLPDPDRLRVESALLVMPLDPKPEIKPEKPPVKPPRK